MSITAGDFGVLRNLATALGFLDSQGDPNPAWFGAPDESLKQILADDAQREALIAFVDEALGGADRTIDRSGAIWLPIVSIDDPQIEVSVTLDDEPDDSVSIGVGVVFRTTDPGSRTTMSLPLFRAAKTGHTIGSPLLLGQPGARLWLSTEIMVDSTAPTPGEAHLGAIGLELDVPTSSGDAPASFGLTATGLQLPGAAEPHDIHVSATSAGGLDNVLIELILSLVREQASAVGGGSVGASEPAHAAVSVWLRARMCPLRWP